MDGGFQNSHAAQQQQHDDRADVDAADRRDDPPERPQDRVRHPVQEGRGVINELVATVDHVEREQPAEDRRNDDRPPQQVQQRIDDEEDEIDDGGHGFSVRTLPLLAAPGGC